MGKAARIREKRDREEMRRQTAAQAERQSLTLRGYPVEQLRTAMAEQDPVAFAFRDGDGFFSGGVYYIGRIVKTEAAKGPRVFVVIEMDAPSISAPEDDD